VGNKKLKRNSKNEASFDFRSGVKKENKEESLPN